VSLGPEPLFKGENSSSRRTSQTANVFENGKTSKTNFSNLIPFISVGLLTCIPFLSIAGIFFFSQYDTEVHFHVFGKHLEENEM